MSESLFKTKFKKSVLHHKGKAWSISAPTIKGLPDLFVVMPDMVPPCVIEAKYLKGLGQKFKRTIGYTPLQRKFLLDSHAIHPYSAFGLVGFDYMDQRVACLVHPERTVIDNDFMKYTGWDMLKGPNHFNVKLMFQRYMEVNGPSHEQVEVAF